MALTEEKKVEGNDWGEGWRFVGGSVWLLITEQSV